MANINFKTINSSDYVSPSVINSNFQLVDPLGYDYVTSQGTSGNWNFRKWKSGICELWGNLDYASGSGMLNCVAKFPVSFKSRPTSSVVAGGDSMNYVEVQYVKSSTTDVNFWISRGDNACATWAEVHVIGRIS